ncbi:hypothetical protein GN316_15220 [Xylophilus sp. Kf1]|nr:hypothetical protein [Xylophilus sp. Kf1]
MRVAGRLLRIDGERLSPRDYQDLGFGAFVDALNVEPLPCWSRTDSPANMTLLTLLKVPIARVPKVHRPRQLIVAVMIVGSVTMAAIGQKRTLVPVDPQRICLSNESNPFFSIFAVVMAGTLCAGCGEKRISPDDGIKATLSGNWT